MTKVKCILVDCGWDPYKFNMWKNPAGEIFARDKAVSPNLFIKHLIIADIYLT